MQLEDAKSRLTEKESEVTELLAQAHRRRQQMLLSPERASHRAPTPSNTWQAARDVLGRLCNTVQDLMENGEQLVRVFFGGFFFSFFVLPFVCPDMPSFPYLQRRTTPTM